MNSVDTKYGGSSSEERHEAQSEEVLHGPKKILGFDVTEYKNENDNMEKRSKEGVCGEGRESRTTEGGEIKMKCS